MKILILSPNQINRRNWTHQLFRTEFSKHHKTVYYGEGFPNYIPEKPIPEVIKDYDNFDLILTYGMKYTEPFIGIGEITNIPKAHIVIDYFNNGGSGTYERNHKLFERDKYDIYFATCGNICRNLVKNKICEEAFILPFSMDTNIYKKLNLKKENDVFAVFSLNPNIYPYRKSIQKMVFKTYRDKAFIKSVQHLEYIQEINKSKICITSNNKFKSFSIKYTEILACGGFLLADKPEDFDEFGFVDKKHLVLYSDINDLKEKISYYLKRENERERISFEGMNFIRDNHNNSIRVKQFTKIIQDKFGIK